MKSTLKQSVFILLLSTISVIANAQCTFVIAGLPDTMNVCKNSTTSFNPVANSGATLPVYIDTFWTPTVGLSNPDIINPTATFGTGSIKYTVTIQSITAANLIPNGDFSLGYNNFTSSYIVGTGGTWGAVSNPGTYSITTNPNLAHSNFANFGDHTTGTGNMMVINGASSAIDVWCETISVTPNTWYDFSAWGASCVTDSPAILQFKINGVLQGSALSLPTINGQWTQFHTKWYSGALTTISICINDKQTYGAGNDFALDDIAFKEICSVSDSVYLKVTNLTPSIQYTKHLGCTEDTVNFYAPKGIGDSAIKWRWNFGDFTNYGNQQSQQHIYAVQNQYPIKLVVQSADGCKDSLLANIDIRHDLKAKFHIDKDTTCIGEQVKLTDQSVTSGPMIIKWTWDDGTSSYSPIHKYDSAALFNIKLFLQDTLGCKDSVTHSILVLNAPYGHFTVANDNICDGELVFFKDSINKYTTHYKWTFDALNFPNDTLINVSNPKHTYSYSPNDVYAVLTASNDVCIDHLDSIKINVNKYPIVNLGADKSVCDFSTSITLRDSLNTGKSYLWSNGDQTSSTTINEPGSYWLQVTNGLNCTTSDTINILRDCYLNIPNSFTPNGDGISDYFLPRKLLSSGLKSFSMNIFNRWGENIFTTTNINGSGWDGKFGLKEQPLGTYIYQIDVQYINDVKHTYTGNVLLIR